MLQNQETEITQDNIFNLLQNHEKSKIFENLFSKEIDFASSHFYELIEKQEDKFNDLSFSTIERIIQNDKLRLNDENQLLTFINHLYTRDNKFSVLYENVLFTFISVSKISEFLNVFDFIDLNTETWISLSHRLQQEISMKDIDCPKERYMKQKYLNELPGGILFKYDENKNSTGIINHLKSKGSIQNVMNITSSSQENDNYRPEYSLENSLFFASRNAPNSWVCFDFKEHHVIPTNYTMGSTDNSYHPKNWAIEGSKDNVNWEIIDSQENCPYMNANKVVHSFKIKNQNMKKYRYIRVRQTGLSYGNNHYFRFNSFELYGYLF